MRTGLGAEGQSSRAQDDAGFGEQEQQRGIESSRTDVREITFAALLRRNTRVARGERWDGMGWDGLVRRIKTEGFVLMTKPSVFCITCRSLGFPKCG